MHVMTTNTYQEYVVKILETSERVTQNKKIKICKV
jgi:hypothetical protein